MAGDVGSGSDGTPRFPAWPLKVSGRPDASAVARYITLRPLSGPPGPAVVIMNGSTTWNVPRINDEKWRTDLDQLQLAMRDNEVWFTQVPHFFADALARDGQYFRMFTFAPGVWYLLGESLLCGAVLTAALVLGGRGIDRRRRAERLAAGLCPECGYPRGGGHAAACPECGVPAPAA